MTVRRTGDWAIARRLLGSAPAKLKAAIGTAIRQEAQALRTQIVQGITRQAPGGEPFKELSPLTIAKRQLEGFGGSKALIVRADLRNSVTAITEGDEAFVGVLRRARGPSGESLVDVAQIHEFGAGPFVIPMTPAMRRFLFVLLRRAGKEPSGAGGPSVVVVSIPARPFLRPAFREFSQGAQRRFLDRMTRLLGWGGGR